MKSAQFRSSMKRSIAITITFAVLLMYAVPHVALAQAAAKVATQRSPVAPTREQVQAALNEAYEKFRSDTSGKNADYIPELAHVDSKLFGIAIVTTDNQVLTAGDVDVAFSIQSISKVFTLALAMEELGPDRVFDRIGSEPTGRAFNSVTAVVEMPTRAIRW